MRSISAKVSILYIFLTILNISVFTLLIFENQFELITQIKKLESKEDALTVYSQLNNYLEDMSVTSGNYQELIVELADSMSRFHDKVMIFSDDRKYQYSTTSDFALSEDMLGQAQLAFSNKSFTGQVIHSHMDENSRSNHFFIPFSLGEMDNLIFYFQIDFSDIDDQIQVLYRMVFIITIMVASFHIGFGLILHRLLIRPIQILSEKSNEISKGNLSARVNLKRKDEFGSLSEAFNSMAKSVQDTIIQLDKANKIMKLELKMAGQVQKSIYPRIRDTKRFKLAIHHRPLIEVSGDYHDIIPLGHDAYGCLIADVSGHGVAAALITMLIKDSFIKVARAHSDSREVMQYINKELGNLITEYDRYFTAFYLVVDDKKNVTFTNAGHHKAYLTRLGASQIWALDSGGVIVGMSPDMGEAFESKRIQAKSGDKLILITDGIIEGLNSKQELYGHERLLKAIKKYNKLDCERMLLKVMEDYNTFIDPKLRRDDETMIILQVK
ncbi:MAG: SpoIIE family protein phosphatase [Spirochaetales bacterium]|nr:SpoIIE family protein phosphatase [Spirochaetales bacterium]